MIFLSLFVIETNKKIDKLWKLLWLVKGEQGWLMGPQPSLREKFTKHETNLEKKKLSQTRI